MTKQEILNKIEKDFKGKASYGSACFYLTNDGRKCPIGLFIPDGHEAQKVCFRVNKLLERYPDLYKYMPSKNVFFLKNFQTTHDLNIRKNMPLQKQKDMLKSWVNDNYDKYNHQGAI